MEARRGVGRGSLSIGLVAALVGCQASLQQTHQFPTTWPGSTPLSEEAPTVSVEPLKWVVAPPPQSVSSEEGLPTAAVLSALLIKYLQVSGVNAILEKAETSTAPYTLQCTVQKLGYSDLEQGYPRKKQYQAELACELKDEQTQAVVWERTLAQAYEQTVWVNMMTGLPAQPHAHDRMLYQECIVPLWDAMASSVGAVLVSRQQLSRHSDVSKAEVP